MAQLRARLARTSGSARAAVERELAAASNQLELNRLRLDFITKLGQLDASVATAEDDLAHQVKALQDTVPELKDKTPAAPVVAAVKGEEVTSGTRALIYRLLALQRARTTLKEVATSTGGLIRDAEGRARRSRRPSAPRSADSASWPRIRPRPAPRSTMAHGSSASCSSG